MNDIRKRKLGGSGLEVSMIGMGCWAIGGKYKVEGSWSGWGPVDDNESVRALHRALDLGVTFFDTADAYGCGHSERLLAEALGPHREEVIIATKVGNIFNEETKEFIGRSGDSDHIRKACEDSLRRLGTETIDLYQFHIGNYDLEKAGEVLDTFEDLVAQGKIRCYGWSTDDPERASFFAGGEHYVAVQQAFNIFHGNEETLAICEQEGLASIVRGPLARGLLTGKFTKDSTPPDDLRGAWDFEKGELAEQLDDLNALHEILTRDGRSLAQAALGWLWARSPNTIPIPGFKTVAQVEENVGACRHGSLSPQQMREIATVLA